MYNITVWQTVLSVSFDTPKSGIEQNNEPPLMLKRVSKNIIFNRVSDHN